MLPSILLYNPAAGRNRKVRSDGVRQVLSALRAQSFLVYAEATRAPGGAAQQAADAIRAGAAAVFACGGDGTVHEVLQGVAGTGALLGIVPFGSANALAQELKLSRNPVQAARGLHPQHFVSVRTTAVHRAERPTLYSLCMAGAGPDGLLMYRMLTVDRAHLGQWRYYEHALRIFCSQPLRPFRVLVTDTQGEQAERVVVSAMALRIGDLRGIFRGLARGASIHSESLHVVLVAPPARVTLPLWFLLAWLGLQRLHGGVQVVRASAIQIPDGVPLQVDGEWAGRAAADITINGPLQRVLVPSEQ